MREPGKITTYARGGLGYSGCQKPLTRGTYGGNGGSLSAGRTPYAVFRSFDGRNGGDGEPPGKGGKGGTHDRAPELSDESFTNGLDGKHCPTAAYEYEFKDAHATWTNPFDHGAPVSGTISGSLCGNPSRDAWTVEKVVGGTTFRDFLLFLPGAMHDTITMFGYRNLDGSFVADANVHFSLQGTPPDITLSLDPAPVGSTSFLDLAPRTIELHGTLVGTTDDCH